MTCFSPIILFLTLLSVGTLTRAEEKDDVKLIDFDMPEIVTFLDDYMFDQDTADQCYYVNQNLLCFNMNEHKFYRQLEKKNVNRIKLLRLKNSQLPIDQDYLKKFYENIEEIYLEDTRPSNLKLDSFWNVNRIVFENAGLENLNPNMIPRTDKLTEVTITYNRIQHISDITFHRTPQIRRLDLSHNDLRGIDKNAFGMLTELEDLKLNHNYLRTLDINLLQNCTKLKHLNLGHNMFFHFDFYFFDSVRDLRSLDISYNPIFYMDHGVIFGTRFKHLAWYKIDGLPCSTLELKFFEKLKRYYYLLVSERHAHIVQQRDPALCQRGSTACVYQGELYTDERENTWWEKKILNIICVDYYGLNWRNSLQPYRKSNITELAEDLLRYAEFLTHRELYAVEVLAITDFLTEFVGDVAEVHKKIGDVKYYDEFGWDRCSSE